MKKICCVVLAVLCILPCLAGCGTQNKYEEQRVILDADLTQPGAICMQYRDLSFEIEQLQITDKESGVVTNTVVLSAVNTTYPKRREIAIPKRQKEELFSGDLLQREEKTTFGVQRGEHGCGGLLFAGHLWMAVGALQKAGVAVTGQLRHRLLVDATVQQRGDEKVAQGVQVILSREAVGGVDLS